MYDPINDYFHSLFSKLQCGFRKGFNAKHCLLASTEKCREVLDKGRYAGVVLTNLSKAFDCINHELLLLFDDIDIDLANYADDTTPYAYDLENDKVIKLLEKNINKFLDWFSDNFLKANPDICHLLINTDENVPLKIKNETITNSSNQKVLRILFNNKFGFDEDVTSLCRKSFPEV